jgi:hypothetical protein
MILHGLDAHSSIDGHLSCLYILTIMNEADINIPVQFLFGHKNSLPLSKYQGT